MPLPQWPAFQGLARAVAPARVAGPVLELALGLVRVAAQAADQGGPVDQARAVAQAQAADPVGPVDQVRVADRAMVVETVMVAEMVTAVGQAEEMVMLVGMAISAAMADGDDILRHVM